MQNLKPMDAVAALYSDGHLELSQAIVASLSDAIFNTNEIRPAGRLQRTMALVSYRVLQRTTKSRPGKDHLGREMTLYSNALLEWSGHPYARALLGSSMSETAALVEGGDPMNGNYMLLAPQIRVNGGVWDRLLLDTVQGKDVRLRLALETRATYAAARQWLDRDEPVRLKAVAAGTGLSMILVYDKLVQDGYNPELITVRITDRDEANTIKTNRLLAKLGSTRECYRLVEKGCGISAEAEDIFDESRKAGTDCKSQYDIVTAVGILEYFQGFTFDTTEQRLNIEPAVETTTAQDLAMRLYEMTTDRAHLIINTYRDDPSTRILELFGRRFDYRHRENLRTLLSSVNFHHGQLVGSGNIYDVEVYQKQPLVSRTPGASI